MSKNRRTAIEQFRAERKAGIANFLNCYGRTLTNKEANEHIRAMHGSRPPTAKEWALSARFWAADMDDLNYGGQS